MKMSFGRTRAKKHGILLDQPLDDDERCRNCDGLCCRSFTAVDVSWEEYEQLRELGAIRLHFSMTGHHQLIIDHDCEFLRDGKCGIYTHRPDICRRFICRED